VPVLGLYGGADAGIPVATTEQMKVAVGANTPSTFQVYADAPHAFFADYRPRVSRGGGQGWLAAAARLLKRNGVA
jgi:carboxymethylenebutenolidase